MKTPILKAVAMPPKIFFAPMMPAVLNCAVQMALMIALMGAFPREINPLTFIFTITIVHVILVAYGVREPHLSTIIPAWYGARGLWDKEDKLKAGLLGPKADAESVQIRGQQIRVIRISGKAAFAEEWRKWLMAMARYPIGIQIWSESQKESIIILYAEGSEPYRLKEAVGDTLSLLREFQPEELRVSDVARIWENLLVQNVKVLKNNGVFVAQNSSKYMACLSVNRWGDDLDSNMVADLLALGEGVRIQQQMKVLPSVKANALLIQQRKMAFFTTFSQNVYNQYTHALEAIDSLGEFPQVAVQYAFGVWVEARSMTELDGLLVQAMAALKRYGVEAVREKGLAKAAYLTQFLDVVGAPRRFLMLSDNVVSGLVASGAEGRSFGAQF